MGPAWDFAVAPQRPVPGVSSMVGYRAVDVPDSVHAGLPSAQLTFIVSLDDGIRASFERSDLATTARKRVLLAGLHTRPSHVEQSTGQAGVQLAVHPLAARALFGCPAAELAELDIDGAGLLGGLATELADRLAAPNLRWRNAFEEVAAMLRDRWSSSDAVRPRPELCRAWDALTRSAGRAPIGAVADAAGVSTRHLGTLFRAEVGLAPKTVARLIRFEAVIGMLGRSVRAGRCIELAEIADAHGYADQAHLTREFSRLAGTSPGRWAQQEFRNLQDGGHGGQPDSTP
ncbi:helix-turn-helix domain-containing protein [Nakamurella sp. A5-74]|uniref:Helix-turn-helix domain-containing protein n=1 Tax=Nakamurella sp. A5-74 TaxID=3158264 RepID=A0AAU8DS31_9ACTN